VDAYHRRALQRPRIYDFLTLLGRGPLSLPLLAACLRSLGEYDVVLVGFMPFALPWYVTHLARWRGTPVVLLPLFHPEDPSHHFRSLYWCFEQAAAVLAQSPYSASLLRRLWPASNPVEVGPGTDLRAFASPAISGERFRRRHGLEGKRLALFVGRKELYKRYDLAVEAVDLIAHERIALVMVGADVDRRPIISPHVLYLGALPRDELLDAFDACDVLVVPSEHESFGIVLLEAWARRKPVIGNAACGPVASVIADGRDGFVCRNAEEVARAIVRVLTDASLAQRLGEAGHEKVARRYTWERIAERVHDVYRSVTASRRPPDRSAAMGSRDERTPRHHD